MKHLLHISLLLCCTFAFSQESLNQKLVDGFKTGSAEDIASFFNGTLDLHIPEIEGPYSKDQAQFILKDFFLYNTVKSFGIKHDGSSSNDSYYAIGELVCTDNAFRVYILYNKVSHGIKISELRIEQDD